MFALFCTDILVLHCIALMLIIVSVKLEVGNPVLRNGSPPGIETVNLNFDETE